LNAEHRFELLDLLADRRLGDFQHLRGTAFRARSDDLSKDLQLSEGDAGLGYFHHERGSILGGRKLAGH
jgi:hypothetical protein